MTDGATLAASTLAALTAAAVVRWVAPPTARLAGRVRPYSGVTRLGSWQGAQPVANGSSIWWALKTAAAPWAERFGQLLEPGDTKAIKRRLRQTGLYRGLDDDQALAAYRVRQLGAVSAAIAIAGVVAVALQLPAPRALVLCGLGTLIGVTRSRGQIDRSIRLRQEVMRIEIYTVNQLLAMRVRAGGGAVHAVQQVVSRGRGEVIGELAEGLKLHRSGMRAAEAFGRLAELTPEPACARTYALLAGADERGADLSSALLDLSEDVRETRRESMRRSATKRRAAMLVPIIGILAPVMLLFVGAPLPQIIFNWR